MADKAGFFRLAADMARRCRLAWFCGYVTTALFFPCNKAVAADVMATLPPLAGLVAMLDPDISTECLLKGAADPHHFQLQPRSIEAMRRSTMLLRASRDDAGWPIPPQHARTFDLWPDTSHAWLSPKRVKERLPALAETLKQLKPEHAGQIEQNLPSALATVEAVETQWRHAMRNIPSVIMQHPSWREWMRQIHVPVLAVLESGHHGHESGPRQLEQALTLLNEHPDTLLLADQAHSMRPLEWLARHADRRPRLITLDPLGRCGERWDVLMRKNLERLRP